MERIIELKELTVTLAGVVPVLGTQQVTVVEDSKPVAQSNYDLPLVAEDFNDQLLELLNKRLVSVGLQLTRKTPINLEEILGDK